MVGIQSPPAASQAFAVLAIPAAIVEANPSFKLIYLNPAFERMTGCWKASKIDHFSGLMSVEN